MYKRQKIPRPLGPQNYLWLFVSTFSCQYLIQKDHFIIISHCGTFAGPNSVRMTDTHCSNTAAMHDCVGPGETGGKKGQVAYKTTIARGHKKGHLQSTTLVSSDVVNNNHCVPTSPLNANTTVGVA